jgi:hypothetical protein
MNRFKWFDFLGALILLFSVTKSALALQGDGVDPSEISKTPPEPVSQLVDPSQPSSKDASEFEDDFLIPYLIRLVDGVSRSPRLQDAIVVEMIRYYDDKSLHQALTQFFMLEYQGRTDPIHPGFNLGPSHAHSLGSVPIFNR